MKERDDLDYLFTILVALVTSLICAVILLAFLPHFITAVIKVFS